MNLKTILVAGSVVLTAFAAQAKDYKVVSCQTEKGELVGTFSELETEEVVKLAFKGEKKKATYNASGTVIRDNLASLQIEVFFGRKQVAFLDLKPADEARFQYTGVFIGKFGAKFPELASLNAQLDVECFVAEMPASGIKD